jgi:hypothetical protein
LHDKHYVYVHKRLDGHIFYVGKGVGSRSHSEDRLDIWHHYVRTRCNGQHEVEIVAYFATEDDALEYEGQLITDYGPQLVNWINPGRQFDYKALELFHRLRKANRLFIASIRAAEATDTEAAIASYRIALTRVDEYAYLVLESGLVAELTSEIRSNCHIDNTDLIPLERITLLLFKSSRFAHLISEVDEFFAIHPQAASRGLGIRILKRRDKSALRV